MRPYRCYFLDDHGAIRGVQVMVCLDDRELAELAPRLLASHPDHAGVEVWERSRRVLLQTAEPRHA